MGMKYIKLLSQLKKCMLFFRLFNFFYCPGKEAAMWIIVVSLPFTEYLCGTFIVLCRGSKSLLSERHADWVANL